MDKSGLNAADEQQLRPRDIIFTIPNFISLLRLISIPLIAYMIYTDRKWAALIILALSVLSDWLDGFLARRMHQISKIGQLLDPLADRLLIFCSVLVFGMAGLLPWWLLIAIGLRDLVMLIEVLVIAQFGYGPLPVHFAGKTGTALLMIAIPALIVADLGQGYIFASLHLAAVACSIWGVVLYWVAGLIYLKQGYDILHIQRVREQS
ncbi:MAG: CDP-alcohol phosphatidyltransferase family protein [Scardovia wiggsiae]|uniref:CDP-alcohol phosphatidyltransferase family protein n=1 Tax=Scardovia wiggsiae TaxID=230143 RepID=UPI003607E239